MDGFISITMFSLPSNLLRTHNWRIILLPLPQNLQSIVGGNCDHVKISQLLPLKVKSEAEF